MYNFPIGVMLDSFRLPVKEAIEKTVKIGAHGFQMYATYGEHSPENMTPAKIRELLDMDKVKRTCFFRPLRRPRSRLRR